MTSYDSGKTNVLAAKDADKASDDGLRGPGRKDAATPLTEIQARVAHEIVAHIRRENLVPGTHLPEPHLAKIVGTSRFPVRAALRYLADLGVVRSDSNKGFFLQASTGDLLAVSEKFSSAAEDPVYLKIAEYRLCGKLPDVVAETDLMRIFSVSRFVIQRAFSRIQQEGWVERRAGRGWMFLPMIDSPEAFEESYALRQWIEPAGILSPSFRPDLPILEECRKQLEFISNGGYEFMSQFELFEASSRFHEVIAICSGNRFAVQTIRRLNQLRRLVEYRHAKIRPARKLHADDHLLIIQDILAGNFLGAAARMRDHLDKARREKLVQNLFTLDE